MSFRFVIGRAGTGKTHFCLESIRERLRSDAVDGPRLVFLVPEQAAQQLERALLDPPSTWNRGGIAAAHRAEVVSFRRLAVRVLDGAGAPARTVLSEPARQMVLRSLVGRRAKELQYYGRVAGVGRTSGRVSGFIERVSATVDELIQEDVDPAQLTSSIAPDDGTPDEDGRRAKFHDLSLVYRDYLEYLGEERIDPSQLLAWTQPFLRRCSWLDGAELWVDGFASFSGLELRTLVTLAQRCSTTSISLLLDPAVVTAWTSDESRRNARDGSSSRLFGKTKRTMRHIRAAMRDQAVEERAPILLAPRAQPRFSGAPSLANLERNLFRSDVHEDAAANTERLDVLDTDGEGRSAVGPVREAVEIVELPSPRWEVEYAVARIVDWVSRAESPFRYRDIAVIVRDLEPYHDLLQGALDARNIPFFMDRRRPVSHHPLVELLRALPAIIAEDMSLLSVRALLKTGLLPLADDALDELENYLLAHGIAGRVAWLASDWTFRTRAGFAHVDEADPGDDELLARVNRTRKEIASRLQRWLQLPGASGSDTDESAARTLNGDRWRAELLNALSRLDIERTLETWSIEAEERGDLDRAEEHGQVLRDVMSLLDDLAASFSGAALSVDELADALTAGLSSLTVGLVPATVDQLLVGSIERSRNPDLKAAILLGFNEGVFPHRHQEEAVLNDDDRVLLTERGVRIGPPSRERVLDEAMLVYIAVTRASERLLITYARNDARGRALRPSPYLRSILAADPGLHVRPIGDPARERSTRDILTARDLVRRLLEEFRSRPPIATDDSMIRARWNGLYARFREHLPAEPSFARASRGLAPEPRETLSPASVQRLLGGTMRTSFSRLECFAACPFQHFARYLLDLKERKEATIEPIDVGQVHHAVLEEFLGEVARQGRPLGALDDTELLRQLDASCEQVAARLREDSALSDVRGAYVLRRSRSDLARILRAQRSAAKRGGMRPVATELPFGMSGDGERRGGIEPLEIWTPTGRRVLVRGVIDRVDVAEVADELLGVVVDYKRTRDKKLDMTRVYHGLSLQLLGYLIALAQKGKTLTGRAIRPIGALYVSLALRYERVDHPDLATEATLARAGTFRPRGVIRVEDLPILDDVPQASRSDVYSVAIRKDGGISHFERSDAADTTGFANLLTHVERRIGELADRILDGVADVAPYRMGSFSPCSWCAMSSVCRFEMGLSDVRFLDHLKRSEVFARLTASGGKHARPEMGMNLTEPRP